jgi:asparagine synthase (glutamine-hydrolysing)
MLIDRLYPYIFKDSRSRKMLQSFFAAGLDQTWDPLYSHLIRWQNTSRTKAFFSEELKSAVGEYSGYEEIKAILPSNFSRLDVVSKAQYLEMNVFLSNYLLSSQGDRVAMAHSLELRPPFLDHRIVEFAGRVPTRLKMPGLNEKNLLKQVFKKMLPETILRRPKHPYRAPVGPAVLNGNSGSEVLSDSALDRSGLFDKTKVKNLLSKLKSSTNLSEIDSMALAGILSSQLVYDRFVLGIPFKNAERLSPTLMIDRRSGHALKRGN